MFISEPDIVLSYSMESLELRSIYFCRNLDHHGTYFGILLFSFHLIHTKVIDPKNISVTPGSPWTPGLEPLQ